MAHAERMVRPFWIPWSLKIAKSSLRSKRGKFSTNLLLPAKKSVLSNLMPNLPLNTNLKSTAWFTEISSFVSQIYGMPEAVIQILPNHKNSINFGHLNFWTRGSKHIQAFLCIYRPRICFMGLHFTGLVNTGYRSVFTEKKCFIASVFGNTEFCNYRLVLQACNYRILYFL